jgi:hypothetical protein
MLEFLPKKFLALSKEYGAKEFVLLLRNSRFEMDELESKKETLQKCLKMQRRKSRRNRVFV